MPYASNQDLPAAQVRGYSEHQKTAFRKAFNAALREYGDEATAFRVAHAAAKKAGGGKGKTRLRLRKKA
jgi:cation transport regulator